jgi:hypothetical protein
VSCSFDLFLADDRKVGNVTWKRKAWYVNASVNAWHLHRCLMREARELFAHRRIVLTRLEWRNLSIAIRDLVALHYYENYLTKGEAQYFGESLRVNASSEWDVVVDLTEGGNVLRQLDDMPWETVADIRASLET